MGLRVKKTFFKVFKNLLEIMPRIWYTYVETVHGSTVKTQNISHLLSHGGNMKVLSLLLCFCLVFNYSVLAQVAGPQTNISGQVLNQKPAIFTPLHLRYISYNQITDNFNIILDRGNFDQPNATELQENAKPLLNYFFIGINLPSDSFWVNLRPDSEDKIVDPLLGKTDIGKILLEADLQLKKDIAQATSPQTPTGKEYWDKLYKKIDQTFGKEDVSIPTLTRPWIVPDEVIVRETEDSAYVYKATLKVMLEGDYLAGSQVYNFKDERLRKLNEYSAQLIKELVIPALNKEINSSQRYAALRQVYYSLILSQWFKARFAGQTGQYASLIDKKDLSGLTSAKPWDKALYFKDYQKSFNEREYNLKESVNAIYGRSVKSYYSGGANLGLADMFARPAAQPAAVMPLTQLPPTTRMPTQPQAGMPAAQLPPITRLPTAPPAALPSLTGAPARVVIPAVVLGTTSPAGNYAPAPVTDTSVVATVSGLPGVGLRVTLAPPAAERQLSIPERRARVTQGLANVQTGIISEAAPVALAPRGPMTSFEEAPSPEQRGTALEQLLAARSPQVYTVEGIPFIPVAGLLASTRAYGAPTTAVLPDLGKTFGGRPVVYISAEFVGNPVVEGYAVNMIRGLSTEAARGRIPGARTLQALSTLMGQNPRVALPAIARVDRQVKANPSTDINQVVPGHYAGLVDLANPAVGLPQRTVRLAVALQNLQAPGLMATVTSVGNSVLPAAEQPGVSPRSRAVRTLVAIVTQPLAMQIRSMGPERMQQLAAGGGELAAFVDFLSRAQQTLANVPGIPAQVLNPAPVVSARLEPTQASLIPRDILAPATPLTAETPALPRQVIIAVRAPGLEGMVSVQFRIGPEGLEANVIGGELNRPMPPVRLEPGRLVEVRAVPVAPATPGAVNTLRLVAQQQAAPGSLVTAPEAPVLGLTLTPEGGLSIRNMALKADTSVEVTARPTTPTVEGVVQAPALPLGAVTAPRVEGLGGIDLRVLPIVTQPLSNLSANLNKSTLRSLRNLDLDKEWGAIEKMIQADMIPSAERIKEGIQASCLQGEISLDIDRIVLDISQIFKIEEARYAATEPALRDILVVLGAASSPAEISQVFLGKI